MAGNYSFHRSLGRICSKTGEAIRARTEMWSDSLTMCGRFPLTSTYWTIASFARAPLVPCLGCFLLWRTCNRRGSDSGYGLQRRTGMQEFTCFSILSARTRLACLPLGRVLPQPPFCFMVEVTLGL